MFCIVCGKQLPDDAVSCPFCGILIKDADSGASSNASASKIEATALSEDKCSTSPFRSGNDPADLHNVKDFSTPAFFLGWIWCFVHELWFLGVLLLVISITTFAFGPLNPYFRDFFMVISNSNFSDDWPFFLPLLIIRLPLLVFIGNKGNELAWKARPFDSLDHFKKTQNFYRKWIVPLGIIFFINELLLFSSPGFGVMHARDRAQFSQCLETLNGLKVAEEMYVTDHNIYTANMKELAMYMIPGCNDPKGIAAPCDNLAKRIDDIKTGNCRNGTVSITLINNGFSYQIKGASLNHFMNRGKGCGICITPNGYTPAKLSICIGHPPPAMDCP